MEGVSSMSMAVVPGQSRTYNTNVAEESTPWGNMSEEMFFASLPKYDMLPLANWENNHVVMYALLYAALFLVGVCGNISVITLIRHVHTGITMDNTMVYVLFLCCVDLASIIPLPMAIVDQLLGFWMFGTFFCKLYRCLEHVGRALSTFVLAAMSFDRFLRVCYPHKKITRCTVFNQLFVLSAFTFLLLSPLIIRASSEEIVLKEVLLENPYRLARVRIYKCVDHLEGTPLAVFIMYMFLVGFFFPVVMIFFFYAFMVRRLIVRSRSIKTSQLPVARVAGYTIAISVFFVLCWSPYWIAMLYLNLYRYTWNEDQVEQIHASERFIYIMYGIHALPYVNSASNWLLYGLLNSQLMRRSNESKRQCSSSHRMSRAVFNQPNPISQPLTTKVDDTTPTNGAEESSLISHRPQDALL
ncbi:unnamed protein product [Bursaphelenchus xylophilus]|uniref:(pine wood nematode) hypothetical protein n=1 Tax=Bursaphelenchus xylophilus TaxID=6326 RepID=A0A1I7RR12_BURXY|nr:unnamed protein product [Bursaphelenchus xylophilus]CAG9130794.1 unnamed protein product [Bursaphelenchus xylophilus]